jgi:hypothetical protein
MRHRLPLVRHDIEETRHLIEQAASGQEGAAP